MTGSSADFHWPWSELDLNPNVCSARDVKRAYAKRLKAIDSERDPQAFQSLRAAYEYARECASTPREMSKPEPFKGLEGDTVISSQDVSAPEPATQDVAIDKTERVSQLSKYEVLPLSSPSTEEKIFEPDMYFDYSALVDDMSKLVAAGNFLIGSWKPIMADLFDASIVETRNFERALVDELAVAGWNRENAFELKATAAWVELIEERFEWVADGIRFQRDFPQYILLQKNFQGQFQKWNQATKNQQMYAAESRPVVVTDEDAQLPFYFRWWFVFGLYLILKGFLSEMGLL